MQTTRSSVKQELVAEAERLLNLLVHVCPLFSVEDIRSLSSLREDSLAATIALARALLDLVPFVSTVLPQYDLKYAVFVVASVPSVDIRANVRGLGELQIDIGAVAPIRYTRDITCGITLRPSRKLARWLEKEVEKLLGKKLVYKDFTAYVSFSGSRPDSIDVAAALAIDTTSPAYMWLRETVLKLLSERAGGLLDFAKNFAKLSAEYLVKLLENQSKS